MAKAIAEYSIEYWDTACTKVYKMYSIRPWKLKDKVAIEEAKRLVRDKSNLYLRLKLENSIFLEKFNTLLTPQKN